MLTFMKGKISEKNPIYIDCVVCVLHKWTLDTLFGLKKKIFIKSVEGKRSKNWIYIASMLSQCKYLNFIGVQVRLVQTSTHSTLSFSSGSIQLTFLFFFSVGSWCHGDYCCCFFINHRLKCKQNINWKVKN